MTDKKPRYQTTAAKAAKLIRQELKEKYPNKKFKVTSQTYSGGSSVNVTNFNGFGSREEVEEMDRNVTRKYEAGSFNGMEDIYEYTNRNDDLPQVKFVFLYNGVTGLSGGYGEYGTDYNKKEVA